MQLINCFVQTAVNVSFLKRDWGEKKALNYYQGIRYFKIL